MLARCIVDVQLRGEAAVLLRFERDTNHLLPLLQQLDRYAMRTKRAPSVPLLREMLMNERDATTTDPV